MNFLISLALLYYCWWTSIVHCYYSNGASSSSSSSKANKHHHHRLVTLTPKEYSEWYSKQEIDCINEVPGSGPCAITENCRHPLHNRTFWKKGIQGFNYPREHTIINLWTELWGHKRNVSLVFIGDFSTKQRIHFMNLDTARYMGSDFLHHVDTKEESPDEVGNHFRAYFSSKELNTTVGKICCIIIKCYRYDLTITMYDFLLYAF